MLIKQLKKQDWILNASVLTLIFLGLLTIRSVAPAFFLPQIVWLIIGLSVAFFALLIDFRPLITYKWFGFSIYISSVALLILTQIFGPSIRQAKSWLVIGPAHLQTSEIAKLALIIILSYFFARGHIGIARIKNILISFIFFIIPAVFIFLQPDLGSTIILFAIWAGFLFVSGIPWRRLLVGILIFSVLAVFAWNFALASYQKERLIGFLNPNYDPLGVNYSVIQSKIAVGSAGILGKGYGQGTQAKLGFLPESHSDFIFSAFVEEWGLVGSLVLIVSFSLLLLRIILVGFKSQNNFFRLICLGVVIMFLAQFTLNTGSALGLLPVTGVTFPFFSYGGSSLLTNMLLIGIIQSIAIRSSFIVRETQ
jgi:rod shape determining protein RodA